MNIFEEIRLPGVDRNTFDLSHRNLLTTSIGRITPNLVMECVPGDRINIKCNNFTRFAPMQFPIYENIDIHQRFFFVPLRLIWNDWEDFITGGEDGTFTADAPYVTLAEMTQYFTYSDGTIKYADDYGPSTHNLLNESSTMWDYLGYPCGEQFSFSTTNSTPLDWINSSIGTQKLSTLPIRAWAQIWNDWFRDQNFKTNSEKINFSKNSGKETPASEGFMSALNLRSIAYKRDYFTSALPDPQRGPDVALPMSFNLSGAPVYGLNANGVNMANASDAKIVTQGSILDGSAKAFIGTQSGVVTNFLTQFGQVGNFNVTSAGFTINDFRHANALQKFYEINARGGSRYIEQLKSHFDVTAPDFRLQRAEYLGGDVQRVGIQEVTQTSNSLGTGDDGLFENGVVGDMYGKATSSGQCQINHYCYEHGYIIGVSYAVPRSSYSQGIHKSLQRRLREDYYFPSFAHLGEQAIANKELYIGQKETGVDPDATFGYTPRYAEYKYLPDVIRGDFKTSMKDWHLSRFFSATPKLNTDFIRVKEDTRIFSVEENVDGTPVDHLWTEMSFNINAERPMPYFGTPDLS